ncbi:MAG: TVP38/TMEM64 family protein [Clostridia bacterium]|nr:TVP38/TMEM64 family protein [Clostridia bacterium]
MEKTANIKYMSIVINFCTILGLTLSAVFMVYGIKSNIFVSSEALNEFLSRLGIFAPVVFVMIQAIQVVFPILPGAIGCLGGVLIFGAFKGFIYNYVGICLGSFAAFMISRKYGVEFVKKIIGEKKYNKYAGWLERKNFNKMFALAIFLPCAPDDFLCFLAGLTKMSFIKYVIIILAGKPLAIFLYSAGLKFVSDFIIRLVA